MSPRGKKAPVVSYPPEAILEIEHVAAWFRVGTRTIQRKDFPCFYLGTRTQRFIAGDCLQHARKIGMAR